MPIYIVSTPHSSRFAGLAFGAFYFAVPFLTSYMFIKFWRDTIITQQWNMPFWKRKVMVVLANRYAWPLEGDWVTFYSIDYPAKRSLLGLVHSDATLLRSS